MEPQFTVPTIPPPHVLHIVTHLCEKDEGIANGNKVSVIPRSLMERLMMKNSAGFSIDRL